MDSDIWIWCFFLPSNTQSTDDSPEENYSTSETCFLSHHHHHHQPSTNSGGECKLVLLYRFLHPGTQSGFVEGSKESLLGAVILHCCLLGLVVAAGPHCSDTQGGRELRDMDRSWTNFLSCKSHERQKKGCLGYFP